MTPIIVDTYWISKLNHGSMLAGQGMGIDYSIQYLDDIYTCCNYTINFKISCLNDKENMVNTISTSIFS